MFFSYFVTFLTKKTLPILVARDRISHYIIVPNKLHLSYRNQGFLDQQRFLLIFIFEDDTISIFLDIKIIYNYVTLNTIHNINLVAKMVVRDMAADSRRHIDLDLQFVQYRHMSVPIVAP